MKKKQFIPLRRGGNFTLNFILCMKLTIFLIFISVIGVTASSYSQVNRFDLNFKDVTVKTVFDEIKSTSDFDFFCSDDDFDEDNKVSINVKNASIEEILDKILDSEVLTYKIMENIVVVTRQEAKKWDPLKDLCQSKIVNGKVTDTNGEPLPGVNIIEKGTTNGTVTNLDGNYTISASSANAVLVYSYVGYLTEEVTVGGQTVVDISLVEDITSLDEVVVIGYGTVYRKDLTGPVSSVSGAALKDIPVTSAAQAIVGRMAGVQVTKTEGSPDANIKIRVRGGGSITQDNSPLYIVDGFPVDNIDDIATADIASIDVLKDASSTAIYGARGANGVVLVTTKQGFEGKGKISYNAYYGVKNITKTYEVLNPYEYVLWQYEREQEQFRSTIEKLFGDFQDFGLYKQLTGSDWQNELFGRTGKSMYNNLSISGGSKISKYNISVTHNGEEEIMIGSGYTRTNLTIKTNHKISNWLTIDLNTRLSDTYLKGAGTYSNSRLLHAIQFRPIEGLTEYIDHDLSGDNFEAENVNIRNPVKQTDDDYRRKKTLMYNFNGSATIRLSKNLKYKLSYGSQYGKVENNRFYGLNTTNVIYYGEQPMASIAKTNIKSYRLSNVLSYDKKNFLPGSNISAIIGEELNFYKTDLVTTSAKYFPKYIDASSALSIMSLGTADPVETLYNPANKLSSFFGRVNYDYKGKYLASTTFRADGSSKFAPGNQWGFFPSAALSWRISEERFMSETNQWLNNLKLRFSYGKSGNNRISDDAWKKTFSIDTGTLVLGGDGENATPTAYLVPNNILSNPSLKWETTTTNNLGLDFSILDHRLGGSFEVYKNTTRDLLIKATIPSFTGYATQWQNIGQNSNKGLEIVLDGVIIDNNDFKLIASFNIGFNRNRIDKLGETKSWEQSSNWLSSGGPSGDYLIEEGGKVGLMYGYETEGMYSIDDFNYENGTYTLKENVSDNSDLLGGLVKFRPGALKLKDQNGDLVVDAYNDKVIIGDANPKHTGGFNLTTQYKGLDFSAFFNWVYGNDIYNANKLYVNSYYSTYPYRNLMSFMSSDNRFTYIDKATGEEVSDPLRLSEMNKNANIWSPLMNNIPLYSWGIEDGSFLRLNNITLGYSLPDRLLDKIKIEKLRVYVTVYNLWVWTNYSGYDPEVDSQRSTPLTPGIDWCAYPRSRSFNIGLNVEL